MKRRGALALALCLTSIVGFFIVGYGTQIGFFSSGEGSEDGALADTVAEATPTPVPTTAPPEPQIIERYVYEDVIVPAPGSGGEAQGSGGAAQGSGGEAQESAGEAQESGGEAQESGGEADTAGSPDGDTGGTSEKKEGEKEPSQEGDLNEIDLKGHVVAVGNNTFTVTGTKVGDAVISVTPETKYESKVDGSLSFGEIENGMYLNTKVLAAQGDKPTGPGGTWIAVRVKEELHTLGLNGTVVAVGDGTFTVTGTKVGDAVISVTPETKYESKVDGSLSFGEIEIGMYLNTKVLAAQGDGPTGPDGTWIAVRVKEDVPD